MAILSNEEMQARLKAQAARTAPKVLSNEEMQARLKAAGTSQSAPVNAPAAPAEAPVTNGPGIFTTLSNFSNKAGLAYRNFSIGALKGVGSTALGAAQLGSKALESGYNATIGKLTGKEAFSGSGAAEQAKEAIAPEGTAQKVGFGAEQIAEFLTPLGAEEAAAKVASKLPEGAGMLAKAAKAGTNLASEVADVGLKTALQTGGDTEKTGEAAIATAALGGVGKGLGLAKEAVGEGFGGKLINSLIKPNKQQFSFGKNPGAAVAKEGIVAKSLEDLGTKISEKKVEAGQALDKIISAEKYQTPQIDLQEAFSPLEKAIAEAKKNPRTNSALISRLENVKADLLQHSVDEAGNAIQGRNLANLSLKDAINIKRDVGELTRFTGNPSDDKLANSALQNVYSSIRKQTEKVAPELKTANERWGNLLSAEKAVEARKAVTERQNLMSLPNITAGSGGALVAAIATGGAAIPSAIAGLGMAGIAKALGSTPAKTSLAKWLAEVPSSEKQKLYKAVPRAYDLFKKEFGGLAD